MQTAAYVGLKVRGVRGALCCYVAFGLPAFLLMMALSFAYARLHALPAVVSLFAGLQAVIVALVAKATVSFGKTTVRNIKSAVIVGVAFALFALQANPALIILLAALLGLILNTNAQVASLSPGTGIRNTAVPLMLLLLGSAAGFLALFIVDKSLFRLALLMSRIDVMAFGGGFASVPLMFHEIVEVRSWMDASTFLNGIALGQITPGPIVITATFAGFMVKGALGGVIASIAMFLPSFLVLTGIAPWYDRLRRSPWFVKAIGGILSSFVGLLLAVTMRFALQVPWSFTHIALAVAAFIALLAEIDILWVILSGAVISVLMR